MIALSYAFGATVALSKWLARTAIFVLMLTLLLFWMNPVGPTENVLEKISDSAAQIKKAIKPVDLQCLAENIYFEAGNQPELGKVAVGVVTINRTLDHRFPNSICGVVKQSSNGEIGPRCQFSWVCMDKSLPSPNNKNWKDSLRVARMLLEGGYDQYNQMFDDIKFFHAASLKTDWHKKHPRVVQIGDHIFYK